MALLSKSNTFIYLYRLIKTFLKTVVKRILNHDNIVVFALMVCALGLLIEKGSVTEGQSIFGNIFNAYSVEQSAASVVSSSSQYEMTSLYSLAGNSAQAAAPLPSTITTIQNNSLRAYGVIDSSAANNDGTAANNQAVRYEVQDGDSISLIAYDYGVSVDTILWANNLKSTDAIRPGTVLKIPPVDGVLHTVTRGETLKSLAQQFGGDVAKIISFNDLSDNGTVPIGKEIIIPGGKMPAKNAISTASNLVSGVKNLYGASAVIAAQRFANLPNLGDFFALPTIGKDLGILHGRNGVDIDNVCGTPIYAAADGTVKIAKNSGWNGGYGEYIVIAHDNGTETLYGHLSKLLTTVGAVVKKGQEIGLMGTTGHSTGCHLHWETHGAQNPLAKN